MVNRLISQWSFSRWVVKFVCRYIFHTPYIMVCNNVECNWDDQNWSKQPFPFFSVRVLRQPVRLPFTCLKFNRFMKCSLSCRGSGSSNGHDWGSQQTEAHAAAHPSNHFAVGHISFFTQRSSQSLIKGCSCSSHPSSCWQDQWCECWMFYFSDPLFVVLAPVGRGLPVWSSTWVKNPNIKECHFKVATPRTIGS